MFRRRALVVAAGAVALGAGGPAVLDASPATAASTDACVTGRAVFPDKAGVLHPATRIQVQAWDRDASTPDDLLATGRAQADGSYQLCFDNDDGLGNVGQDVYVKFITENGRWTVQRPGGSSYVTIDQGPDNVVDGSTTPLGTTQPSGSAVGAWRVYDDVNNAWEFVPHGPSNCWDAQDTTCRKRIVFNWPVTTGKTGYDAVGDHVDLQAGDEDFPDVVVHETAHAIMDDVYEDSTEYQDTDCTGHQVPVAMSKACAWDEGFADWFALAVNGGSTLDLTGGSIDLDKPEWSTSGWDDGDAVEGRVAGALLDLSDKAIAPGADTWDRTSEGAANIWTTFLRSGDPAAYGRVNIRMFHQFWDQRTSDGFNVAINGGLASAYQNTIDYGFREPLGDYAPLTRPVPIPDHHYTFTTHTDYWSALAIRPDNDAELALYDDTTKGFLTSGPQSGSGIEFVAIDSNANRRPFPHAYEARVSNRSQQTSYHYDIELAQGAQSLSVDVPQTITMNSSDVVAVRDLRLNTDQHVTITVTPNNGQNPELFLLASDPANPSTWVASRTTAAASASVGGPGVAEQLQYTAPRDAYYGFVLVQKKGSPTGSYTVTVS